jgi:outer membrane immunogenic protein
MPDDYVRLAALGARQRDGVGSMRSVICALALLALPTSALADDFSILRGTVPTYKWSGYYGGGQVGYSNSVIKFGTAASSQLSFLLRGLAIEQDEQISSWNVMGTHTASSAGFGGFVGYNMEWENIIFGVEANYNHVSISQSASSSLTRSFSDSGGLPPGHNFLYTVTVGGEASMHISDIATFRARAGVEEGIFLPYVFGGLALGRASTSDTATLFYTYQDFPDSETPPLTPIPSGSVGPNASSNAQNNTIAYGVATGLGVDVGLLPNVFVRGELEYIYFAPLNGIQASVMSARVGAGLKF